MVSTARYWLAVLIPLVASCNQQTKVADSDSATPSAAADDPAATSKNGTSKAPSYEQVCKHVLGVMSAGPKLSDALLESLPAECEAEFARTHKARGDAEYERHATCVLAATTAGEIKACEPPPAPTKDLDRRVCEHLAELSKAELAADGVTMTQAMLDSMVEDCLPGVLTAREQLGEAGFEAQAACMLAATTQSAAFDC